MSSRYTVVGLQFELVMATTSLYHVKPASMIRPESVSGSDRRNPLAVVFNHVSICAGAASLASLVGNALEWRGFLEQLVRGYRSTAYLTLAPATSWSSIGASPLAIDYLVLGGLVALTLFQAAWSGDRRLTIRLILLPLLALLVAPLWPLFFVLSLTWIAQGEEDTRLLEHLRQSTVAVWRWAVSTTLVVVLLLVVNFVFL